MALNPCCPPAHDLSLMIIDNKLSFVSPFSPNKYLSPICHLEEQEPGGDFLKTISAPNHHQHDVPDRNPTTSPSECNGPQYSNSKRVGVAPDHNMATSTPVQRRRSGDEGFKKVPGNTQYFSLRWNNYQSNITSVFHDLLESQSFVDVTLACEDRFLKAHKVCN